MSKSAPVSYGKHAPRFRGLLLSLSWLLVATSGVAHAQDGRQLESVDVTPLEGQRFEVRLRMNESAPAPMDFRIDNPARIAVDLPETALALPNRRQEVDLGPLTTVLAAEANGRTRIVLNLNQTVPYTTRVEGDSVYISVGGEGEGDATTFAADSTPQPQSEAGAGQDAAPSDAGGQAGSGERVLENIDFRRGGGGAGQVVVELSDPRTSVDVREEGGRVIVDFQNTQLPEDMLQRLDVTDFATPVATIDAQRAEGHARLVVTPSGDFDQVAYQSDDIFTLELQEPVEEDQRERQAGAFDEDRDYTGERMTLNFQNIETRAVLQLIADVSDLNIVVSDTVQGNVTLRLQNVPWDQALDILMTTKGLDMRRNGNVMIVAPAEEIAAREQAELEAEQSLQELEPLRSDIIQVNYAKAAELADVISGGSGQATLSDRGSVTIDERTNTLLITDTTNRLEEIRRLVSRLDVPVRQVLIESRIVVVNDDYRRELGVRFGGTLARANSSDGLISMTGSGEASDTIISSGRDNLNSSGQPFPVDVPPASQRYNVNLPISEPAGRFALGILDSDYLVDLELTALQAEGDGRIVSTPRVITANQSEARIQQGVEIPYQEAASSGATATQFQEAVLSLTVTPQITPDDAIVMDLTVTNDTVGEVVQSATGGQVPSIDTRSIVTTVLVNDGETVVLGGIYETEQRDTVSKVPVLGDIPGLGYLFRSRTRVDNNAELLIFVTPRILREGARIN